MEEVDRLRMKSKNLAKIIIVEFAYCSFLYFAYKAFLNQTNLIN